jgi:Domain of unknown function (DUF4407)
MNRLLSFTTGYSPAALAKASPADRDLLSAVGTIILVSATTEALLWGLFGWSLLGPTLTILPFAAAGFIFVLAFDRAAILAADTRQVKLSKMFPWLALRLLFVVTMTVVVESHLAPFMLGDAMATKGAEMQKREVTAHRSELERQVGLKVLLDRVDSDEQALRDASKRLLEIPPEIESAIGASISCAPQLRDPPVAVAMQVRACRAQRVLASNADKRFQSASKERLKKVQETLAASKKALRSAETTIQQSTNAYSETISTRYSATSLNVLFELLRTDVFAAFTVAGTSLLLIVLGLAPYVLKGTLGRTVLGQTREIMADSEIQSLRLTATTVELKAEADHALEHTELRAAADAASDPATLEFARRVGRESFKAEFGARQFARPFASLNNARLNWFKQRMA